MQKYKDAIQAGFASLRGSRQAGSPAREHRLGGEEGLVVRCGDEDHGSCADLVPARFGRDSLLGLARFQDGCIWLGGGVILPLS